MGAEFIELYGRSYPRHPPSNRSGMAPAWRYRRMVDALAIARTLCGPTDRPLHLAIVKCLAEADHLARVYSAPMPDQRTPCLPTISEEAR